MIRGAEIGSDHRLLVADTKFKTPKRERRKVYEKIKIEQLANKERQTEFKEKLDEEVKRMKFDYMKEWHLDEEWERIRNMLCTVAKEVCGMKVINNKFKGTKWWSNRVKEVVKLKKDAWMKYTRSKKEDDLKNYRNLRNEAKKVVKEAKQKSWEEWGNKVEETYTKDHRQFWKLIKNLRGRYGKPVRSMKDENNVIQTETNEVLEVWRKYYSKKFGDPDLELEENYDGEENCEEDQHWDKEEEVTEMDVRLALRKLRVGKAAGEDEVAPEYVKYGGTEFIKVLTKLLQECWKQGKIPQRWRKTIVIPIHKKGNSNDCDNYRAISLSPVVLKVYTRVLESKLRQQIDHQLEDEQTAFRPGRQTQDQIFTIRTICEKGKEVFLAFLDLKAAFDKVPRKVMWETLRKKNVQTKLIRAIKSTFDNVIGCVRMSAQCSNDFKMDMGIKQGDSLSPLLFIAVMDEILKSCKAETPKAVIGHLNLQRVTIQALLFADDVVLISDSEQGLQKAVNEWTKQIKNRGMEMNANKSKVMKISKRGGELSIKSGNVQLEQVEDFEYLGTIINQTGSMENEIRNRVRKGNQAYYQIKDTIFGKKEISTKTKVRVYKTTVSPTLLYGCETWPLQQKYIDKVTTVEQKCYRKIIGKTRRDRVRREATRGKVSQESIRHTVECKQLKWFGHLMRMSGDRKVKAVFDARSEGKRQRGRPRKTWIEGIGDIGTRKGKSVKEMERMTRDRKEWRRWAEAENPTMVLMGMEKEEEGFSRKLVVLTRRGMNFSSSTLSQNQEL